MSGQRNRWSIIHTYVFIRNEVTQNSADNFLISSWLIYYHHHGRSRFSEETWTNGQMRQGLHVYRTKALEKTSDHIARQLKKRDTVAKSVMLAQSRRNSTYARHIAACSRRKSKSSKGWKCGRVMGTDS